MAARVPLQSLAAVPLPPPRPPEQGPPAPSGATKDHGTPPKPGAPVLPTATPEEERVCARLLSSGKVAARTVAPIGGEGGCGIAAPIEVSAVTAGPGRTLGLDPPIEVGCDLADALADWLLQDLLPLFASAGTPLVGLTGTSGYSCRTRNRVAGARLSEHGRGEAVDIAGFTTGGHAVVSVRDKGNALIAGIRRSACARFSTVLGPGSDGYHEAHLHLDLARRARGLRLCQWELS